jgi:hypothetical protein
VTEYFHGDHIPEDSLLLVPPEVAMSVQCSDVIRCKIVFLTISPLPQPKNSFWARGSSDIELLLFLCVVGQVVESVVRGVQSNGTQACRPAFSCLVYYSYAWPHCKFPAVSMASLRHIAM